MLPFDIWMNGIVIIVKEGDNIQNVELKIMAQILFLSCWNFNSSIFFLIFNSEMMEKYIFILSVNLQTQVVCLIKGSLN